MRRMRIENAVPYLGALVTDLDVNRTTDDEWKTLYQTWLDRLVLIVRGQDLSKADFLAYSRRFGRLKPHLVKHTRDPENPEITLMGVTSMAKDTKGEKLILDRGQGWHTDSPWDAEICKGTQLYAIEIPSYGGRERIQFDLLDPEAQTRPPAVHTMVRVHSETGRKSLYVNPIHVIRILDVSETESDRLLAELYWYMLQPNAEYRHKWTAGDLVIWDNRCTVHSAAGGYPADEPRIHWRTTIME
jgi:taurine dioxygenase